jgi:F-type H+-transporting ATPase subunit delta
MNLSNVARPYAKAAFEFALEAQSTQLWLDVLSQAAELSEQEEVGTLIADPSISEGAVADVMIELLAIKNDAQANLIRLLAQYRRLKSLRCIFNEFEVLKEMHEKKMQVQVISAKALSEAQLNEFASALSKKFHHDVSIHPSVDENLIGGAIVKAGDLVIDGSVTGRLDKLREYLKGEQL